jgi:hypothetical protein
MYVLHRHSANETPYFIGVCLTKAGANRASRHYTKNYSRSVGHTFFHVEITHEYSYTAIRAGMTFLNIMRSIENRKMKKISRKYNDQQRRVHALY